MLKEYRLAIYLLLFTKQFLFVEMIGASSRDIRLNDNFELIK